jgi:hypothetical protein
MGHEDARLEAATRGAEVVVASMPTVLWPAVKTRAAGLLGRGSGVRARDAARRLEESRAHLAAMVGDDAEVRGEVLLRWRQELTAAAGGSDHTVTEMAALVDAFAYLLQVLL